MQSVNIQTAQNVNISYEAASVGDRIIAFLIDAIVRIMYSLGIVEILSRIGIDNSTAILLIVLLPSFLYYLWMEIFFNGQSLGKMALNLKVVMLDGTQPTIGAYLIRWLIRIIDITLFTGGVAVLTIIINGKGQRIGDIAASTTVVKLQGKVSVKRHELLKKMPESYQVTFDNAAQLTDTDVAVILEALNTYKVYANRTPVETVAQKVKNLLEIESDLPSVKFLYTIVRDYNYLTSGIE
ncbi:MAG: RDD family protein [Muriicola sp.]|nr:RDD family protein [Muriicola sp.]